jgi:hypothetical protein
MLPSDPELPLLAAALDPPAMARRFADLWRSTEGVALRTCNRTVTEYEPGVRCVASYDLRGEARGSTRRTFGVAIVEPARLHLRFFDEDPSLPDLSSLVRPRELLERISTLPSAVVGAAPVHDCLVFPVRYKPGRSCVVRVLLSTSRETLAVFVKVVPGRSRDLLTALTTIHDARRRAPELPRVPPAALLADLDAVVQRELPGDELGRRGFDAAVPTAERDTIMARAGAAIGALHGADVDAPRDAPEGDLDELRRGGVVLARLAPALGEPYDAALEALSSASTPDGDPVPSHGALRTDQVLVGPYGVGLVDLDGFRRAPAARDLGNLLAYLRWRAIRGAPGAARVEDAARCFVEGYAATRSPPHGASLSRFMALSLLKIAGRRYRDLSVNEWPSCGRLIAAARALIGSL